MYKVGYCMNCDKCSPQYCLCQSCRTKKIAQKHGTHVAMRWDTPIGTGAVCPVCGELLVDSYELPTAHCESCGYYEKRGG